MRGCVLWGAAAGALAKGARRRGEQPSPGAAWGAPNCVPHGGRALGLALTVPSPSDARLPCGAQAAELVSTQSARAQELLDSDFSHRLLDDTKKVVWQVSAASTALKCERATSLIRRRAASVPVAGPGMLRRVLPSRCLADADRSRVRVQPLRPYDSQYYPDKIYLYTGPETPLYAHGGAITDVKGILRQVRLFCRVGGCG